MKRILLISVILAAMLLSACGTATTPEPTPAPTPELTPAPLLEPPSKTTESEQPKVDTFVELTSQIETDQDGVKVSGRTNLPDGAIVTVALMLKDTEGGFGKDLQGKDLEGGKTFPIREVEVQDGSYNTFFDISYYAGGDCWAGVDFMPSEGQPQFILDAFGKNGQYSDGEHVVTDPSSKITFYRIPRIEFSWYPASSEPTSNREDMIEIFKANALAKWGDDYQMVKYEVDNQTEAYDWVVKQTKYHEIMERAKSEWQNDYEMVKYTYENQVEAYEWIMRQTAYPDIMERAKQEWGGDYEMVKYEYENQVKAYKALQ